MDHGAAQKSGDRDRVGLVRGVVRFVAWLGLLPIGSALVLGAFGGSCWALDLFNHFVPLYLLGAGTCTLLFLLSGSRKMTITSGALTLGLGAAVLPWFLPASTDHSGPSLRLAHANVLVGNPRAEEMLGQLAAWSPDVIGLQEIDAAWGERVRALEGYEVVAMETREDSFGIALLVRTGSEIAVRDVEVLRLAEPFTDVGAVACTLTAEGGSVRLLYAHTLPPIGSAYAGARDAMLEACAVWVSAQPGEAIVLGDLNATVWSVPMRRMVREGGLRNSLRGNGLGGSWPTGLPGALRIGIDHALLTDGLVTLDRSLGGAAGSDHLPLRVDVGWE